MTHWTDAGFGTDPEGDAARRAELEPARFDPADLPILADAIRRTAHLVPPSPAEVVEVLGAEVVEALTEPDDPHAVTRTEYPWGVLWSCACGRWEGAATGRGSAAFVEGDYARHRRDEETGRAE